MSRSNWTDDYIYNKLAYSILNLFFFTLKYPKSVPVEPAERCSVTWRHERIKLLFNYVTFDCVHPFPKGQQQFYIRAYNISHKLLPAYILNIKSKKVYHPGSSHLKWHTPVPHALFLVLSLFRNLSSNWKTLYIPCLETKIYKYISKWKVDLLAHRLYTITTLHNLKISPNSKQWFKRSNLANKRKPLYHFRQT